MPKQYKYGLSLKNLIWSFLLFAALAFGSLWLALTNQSGFQFAGFEIEPVAISFVFLILGGLFTISAGILISLIFQQRGLVSHIQMDGKELVLPAARDGTVSIPFKRITSWKVAGKSGRRTLEIGYQGLKYTVKSRLLHSADDFDEIVQAVRSRAPSTSRPER